MPMGVPIERCESHKAHTTLSQDLAHAAAAAAAKLWIESTVVSVAPRIILRCEPQQ